MPRRLDEVLVRPTRGERARSLPGDDLVPRAGVVMDRAFTLPAEPAVVWPWFVQLGRRRGGWYLPARVERLVPPRRRALRRLDPDLLGLSVGDVIPDWGGRDATFTVAELVPGRHLVHTSVRGHLDLSWCIALAPAGPGRTRVQLRLRLGGVRRPWVGEVGGGAVDLLTVAGLAAGLRERLRDAALPRGGSTGGDVGGRA